MSKFTDEIIDFIRTEKWTFAKTMPEWPHEYLVRERVDELLFVKTAEHIRENGYEGKFYSKTIIYFESDGYIYWTMGAPINETTIINRTEKGNSYEERLKNGTLPKQDNKKNMTSGTRNDLLLNLLLILTQARAKKAFNLFDVMHHGTNEKQLSNIFAWLFHSGQTHELGDAFVRIFVDEVNIGRDEPIEIEEYSVFQEVNTSKPGKPMDIADIVLEGDKTVIVVENYHSSSGHGHSFYGYQEYGARDGKRSVVVLLCETIGSSLQTDGWENAPVVTYSNLVKKLYSLIQNDTNYKHAFPLQYGFIIQMEDNFVKGRQINDSASIDFINTLLASGEGEFFRKADAAAAANDLGEYLKEEAIHRFNESREMLNSVKSKLKLFANTTFKHQVNDNKTVFDNASIGYQGIYQWTVNLSKSGEVILQLKFGPSAWFANEKDKDWKLKVANADYSHIFITNCRTKEIRQSAVILKEVLDGLSPDNTKLCEEFLDLISD